MPISKEPIKRSKLLRSILDVVSQRLAQNQRVRRTLPGIGRLHIDRQLPFLCIYRQPLDASDSGTEHLVKAEASYLIVTEAEASPKEISLVVDCVTEALAREFGALLIVEVWAAPEGGDANDPAVPDVLPKFAIHASSQASISRAVEALAKRLRRIKVLKQGVKVEVQRDGKTWPTQFAPLLSIKRASELHCSFLGLTVPPVYRAAGSEEDYPLLARSLRRSVSLALRQAFYEFARTCTSHRPPHFHALGRKAVVKSVWNADRRLAGISDQFDYLLQLTPVNTVQAWHEFHRSKFEQAPEFHYRPQTVDPIALKRELFKIPIERVEDPALQRLFYEKQAELELQLTMLQDRDTPRFLYQSLQLFGGVKDDLYGEALSLLSLVARDASERKKGSVTAEEFAALARDEFRHYHNTWPEFAGRAEVTEEVSGVMVSRGTLLINSDLDISQSRVQALLAHEVGTHVLTYYNAQAQPFQLLHAGLSGYEELQEGIAVLSEYLVGGLSDARLRQLAGRVVAVRLRTEHATFVEAFRALVNKFGFTKRRAYNIVMRVYRGGGLTKDAVYLRGLQTVLQHLQQNGDINVLFVGKIAHEHLPIVRELQYRKVLHAPPLVPRHLLTSDSVKRLNVLRESSCSLAELASRKEVR